MSKMIPKQVRLHERQDRALKELARRTGWSQSALVRHALDLLIVSGPDPPRDPSAWEESKRCIEERMRTVRVAPQKRSWTRDELHDRGRFRRD